MSDDVIDTIAEAAKKFFGDFIPHSTGIHSDMGEFIVNELERNYAIVKRPEPEKFQTFHLGDSYEYPREVAAYNDYVWWNCKAFTPTEAREFAASLLAAADMAQELRRESLKGEE